MTKGIKHKDIGEDLSRTEFEADDSHELESGTSFPVSPAEKDRFYRTDEHKWYIYNGSAWKLLTMPTQTLSPDNENVLAGYYAATTLSAVDADLAVGNILGGKDIFGKTGTLKGIAFVAGDFVFHNNATERESTPSGWYNRKEIDIGDYSGTIRTKFELRRDYVGAGNCNARVYKNGAAVGTSRIQDSESYIEYTEDLAGWSKDDLYQIYTLESNGLKHGRVRNQKICLTAQSSFNDAVSQDP